MPLIFQELNFQFHLFPLLFVALEEKSMLDTSGIGALSVFLALFSLFLSFNRNTLLQLLLCSTTSFKIEI